MCKRLAVVLTHPIQYYSPIFRTIAASGKLELMVFYTWPQAKGKKFDSGFGKDVEWDIPLLEGYDSTFVNNISRNPGSHYFKGIINPTLIQEIERWKPNAVLIFGWNFDSHLKAMRHFKHKIPVYFRGDSTMIDERHRLKKTARKFFLRWVYSNIDFAFYVGEMNKNYYIAHGLKKNQLIFAPHVIDNERFYDNNGNYKLTALKWRRDIGIKDDEIIFLFAGKFEPKKNPLLLLRAFTKINNSNTHLIFVGNGILEEELKNTALNNKMIHFLPFQNQSVMPVVYRLGDVFILPSQGPGETWGLAVNEAMACSLPVIVSNKVGCAVDLVKQNINGFIFTSNNLSDLEKCMTEYLTSCMPVRTGMPDPVKLNRMGKASLQIVKEHSIENLAEIIICSINNN
jgi:glycosyltransferase involved in cell wall biosynthesis